MKFDFTSKLKKFEESGIKPRRDLSESIKAEEGSDTFREVSTIELAGFESVINHKNGVFRSI